MEKEVHKSTIESVLCWPTTAHGVLECHSIGEYLYSICQSVSITISFLVKGGILCPIPLLSAGTLSGLNVCRSCVCCHSF